MKIPWSRKNGNPLQYSCLENSMGQRMEATVHGVAKRWIGLSTHAGTHMLISQPCEKRVWWGQEKHSTLLRVFLPQCLWLVSFMSSFRNLRMDMQSGCLL